MFIYFLFSDRPNSLTDKVQRMNSLVVRQNQTEAFVGNAGNQLDIQLV